MVKVCDKFVKVRNVGLKVVKFYYCRLEEVFLIGFFSFVQFIWKKLYRAFVEKKVVNYFLEERKKISIIYVIFFRISCQF